MKSFRFQLVIIFTIFTLSIAITGCSPSTFDFSISVTPNDGGTISPSSGTFKRGSEVTLVATPSQNYEFTGWAGEASGISNPLTIEMNTNKQIVAQFSKINYSVTINVNPSEGGSVYPSGGTFESGNRVKFTATANKGYRFDHWSGGLTGKSESTEITINSNQAITAHFIKVYNLSISIPTDLGATVSTKSGTYDAGDKLSLETIPSMYPYTFDHWSGTDNDNVNPTTVTIQDPNGTNLGNVSSSFTFNAKIPGRYTIILHNTNTICDESC